MITQNKKNDQTLINWIADAKKAFQEFKDALAATLLAHPCEDARIILCTDVSDTAIGGVIHQQKDGKTELLAFFSRKLSATEKKYSTYDRELLAIYTSVRHFCIQIEGGKFMIYTDHKPLRFAFSSPSENASSRVIRQVDLISQFSTDIRYLPGTQNICADTMSRIDTLKTNSVDLDTIVDAQERDPELKEILQQQKPKFQLKKVGAENFPISLYCDTRLGKTCRYVSAGFSTQCVYPDPSAGAHRTKGNCKGSRKSFCLAENAKRHYGMVKFMPIMSKSQSKLPCSHTNWKV